MAWSARSAGTWSSSPATAGPFRYWSLSRPWRRRWLLLSSAGASALLLVYGGLNVAAAALVLSGSSNPAGGVDRTALHWHLGVWDPWFLVWGFCWRWPHPATGARR